MNIKEIALSVIQVLYNSAESAKTLQTKLSYRDICAIRTELDKDTLKMALEYLQGHGYVTFRDHPVFQDICITSIGVDYYLENYQ